MRRLSPPAALPSAETALSADDGIGTFAGNGDGSCTYTPAVEAGSAVTFSSD